MTNKISRRQFLKKSSIVTTGVALSGGTIARAGIKKEKVIVAVIGCNGRGMVHIKSFLALPNVEIAYICDVDSRAIQKGISAVTKTQARIPKGVQDLRRVLEDPEVDAVSIATPDHWHAPAAILACSAGKHVYVEKPGSHNAQESEWLIAAARKNKRLVQLGNQRRSLPWTQNLMTAIKSGEIGTVSFARCWYTNNRAPIGHGKAAPVPEWLDYSMWQGPAPEQPFKDNLIHYNWHWFWNWGTAELGNNGVHSLDLARWALELDLPKRVTCGGNRYFHKDDWETPDSTIATFDFGHKGIAWEGRSCAPRGFEGNSFGASFYGEKGTVVIAGYAAKVYDLNDKVIREIPGSANEVLHFANFIDAIRLGTPLNSEIEEGQKSTMLCHLGNIAWRSGRTVDFDPKTRKLVGDSANSPYWGRAYRPGWEPKV